MKTVAVYDNLLGRREVTKPPYETYQKNSVPLIGALWVYPHYTRDVPLN